MTKKKFYSGPVAIGGVGGSGTRVVVEILREIGFYIGDDLNSALDNLWFSLLFKRPKWFNKNHKKNRSEIFKGLNIFEKAMTGCLKPKFNEFRFIMKAAMEWSVFGNHFGGIGRSGRGLWPFFRVLSMVHAKEIDSSQYLGWGWKEPNTHVYIEYLNEYFNNLKYIYVVRHGLDMAYSRNQSQLYSWGKLMDVQESDSSVPQAKKSIRYWINANERIVALGEKLLSNRFLVVNFDAMCLNPRREISALINFLELNTNQVNLDKFEHLPKIPKSSGRYKQHDLTIFSKDEIAAVRKFGFTVEIDNHQETI